MREVIEPLAGDQARDQARSFALISEVVWWITIVDATLVRHHPEAYESVINARAPAERRAVSP